ncbi:hypothetical protein [Nocardioides sp.]|jgi:hypothetical protein|uniref:CBU_0592 family membrane protein n=1 Tax=Nocardioides sp. TaxID=35761 RepID=UPI0026200534|nr:hypothetical protein [Nocardioides sp.]
MSLGSVIQIGGSLLVLIPFILVQLGRMTPSSLLYIWLNLIGSGVLAADALHGHQWGFLLLEGTWALVSAYSLISKKPTAGH